MKAAIVVFALIDAALRGMAIALLLLLALLLRRGTRASWPARIWNVFSLTLCVQVASSAPIVERGLPGAWQAPLVGVSVGNAVLFWIFVQSLFQDDFRLRAVHRLAWLCAFLLGAAYCLDSTAPHSVSHQLEVMGLRGVPLVFAILAAVAAGSDWRADLVAARRRLRGFILATGVAYTLIMLGLRLASPHGLLSVSAAGFDISFLLLILAGVTLLLVQGGILADELLPGVPRLTGRTADARSGAPQPDTARADDRLVRTLQRVMVDEHAYRRENLTVATLAQRLAVPEYRLRRVINQRLGHRNFNAYVNGLRLDEAEFVLADPARQDESIMTIALDVGFQSIGPFNRAFKARCGLTPTEFRRQRLADSSKRLVEDHALPVSARPLRTTPGS